MRVVHLTSVHPWNDTRIFIKMCRLLAASGYETHLVVPRNDIAIPCVSDGVVVHRVQKPRSRLKRIFQTTKDVFTAAGTLGGDVYHFHDPEGLSHAVKWQYKLNRPFIYDAHEDYRIDILDKPWLPKSLRGSCAWWFGGIEDRATAKLAGVIAATPAIARRFDHAQALSLIQNYPLSDELFGVNYTASKSNRFVFVGAMSPVRGIDQLVSAMDLVNNAAHLDLAGIFSPKNYKESMIAMPGWEKVTEHGMLDRQSVKELLGRAIAGVVTYLPIASHIEAQPNKLFEYMSAGLPVIASDFPLWRKFIETEACGLVVDPTRPEKIAEAMDYLIEHPQEAREMGERGRKAIENKFNWESEYAKLTAFYETVIAEWNRKAR